MFEAHSSIGGGARSAELTLPGFTHDVCSAVHPFAVISPAFNALPLATHGLEWIQPSAMLAHPLDEGPPAIIERSVENTARGLGVDGRAYEQLFGGLETDWPQLQPLILAQHGVPRHPIAVGRFGLRALRSADSLARATFRGGAARALFAGIAAHGILPLDRVPSAAFGLVLGALAHVAGWVIPRGGAQRVADALAAHLRSIGGTIVTDAPIASLDDLPRARAVLCDLSPKPLLRIAGPRFPAWYRRQLEAYRYGPAAFKVDWALDGPVPWRAPECARAATVHLGGTLEAIAAAERDVWVGRHPERPFAILVQPSLFDPSRAPAGRHTVWAYCHTPNGSAFDMLPRLEQQIERFAPGFRDRILARSVLTPAALEQYNPNLVGGDIAAGASTPRQLFARPTWRRHATPARGVYICSASTPPGVGVHGMCGYLAARLALKQMFPDVRVGPALRDRVG